MHKKEVLFLYISNDISIRIKNLAKSKNVSMQKLLKDVELGNNTMSNMKTSMPKADSLAKIADYLGCSVDYLLGRTDDPESHIDKLSFLDERDHELVASIIEKSYERSLSDVDNVPIHELPRFKAIAYGGDIVENKPLKKPKIPD